jgi:hypothetical protein
VEARFRERSCPNKKSVVRGSNGRGDPVQNWWRKWWYEIPLAFGDALWAVLVVQFADFLAASGTIAYGSNASGKRSKV